MSWVTTFHSNTVGSSECKRGNFWIWSLLKDRDYARILPALSSRETSATEFDFSWCRHSAVSMSHCTWIFYSKLFARVGDIVVGVNGAEFGLWRVDLKPIFLSAWITPLSKYLASSALSSRRQISSAKSRSDTYVSSRLIPCFAWSNQSPGWYRCSSLA